MALSNFDYLPNDLFENFVYNYFGFPPESEIVQATYIPPTLIALQFVSKRFHKVVTNEKFAPGKLIANFHDLPNLEVRDQGSNIGLYRPHVQYQRLILRNACKLGSITLVEWFQTYLRYPLDSASCYNGGFEAGSIPLLNWLRAKVPLEYKEWEIAAVVSTGRVAVVDWVQSLSGVKGFFPRNIFIAALTAGHTALAHHFYKKIPPKTVKGLDLTEIPFRAIESGKLEVLQYAMQHFGGTVLFDSERLAATVGREFLQFIFDYYEKRHERQQLMTDQLANSAASDGRVDVLEYLKQERGLELNAKVSFSLMVGALRNAHCEVVDWCTSHGFPFEVPSDTSIALTNKLMGEFLFTHYHCTPKDLRTFRLLAEKLPKTDTMQWTRLCIPRAYWRILTSLGVKPIYASVISAFKSLHYFACDTLRYLLDELQFEVTPSLQAYLAEAKPHVIRKDVLAYVRAKKIYLF